MDDVADDGMDDVSDGGHGDHGGYVTWVDGVVMNLMQCDIRVL